MIFNFDVRDRRWWIVFNCIIKTLFATASPPCISRSGAAFSARLDQVRGGYLFWRNIDFVVSSHREYRTWKCLCNPLSQTLENPFAFRWSCTCEVLDDFETWSLQPPCGSLFLLPVLSYGVVGRFVMEKIRLAKYQTGGALLYYIIFHKHLEDHLS